jgi:hypothetical protein
MHSAHQAWWDEGVRDIYFDPGAAAKLFPRGAYRSFAYPIVEHAGDSEDSDPLSTFYAVIGRVAPEVVLLQKSVSELTAADEEDLGTAREDLLGHLRRSKSVEGVSNGAFWYGDVAAPLGGMVKSPSVEFIRGDRIQDVRGIPFRPALRISCALEDSELVGVGSNSENGRMFAASCERLRTHFGGSGTDSQNPAAALSRANNPWGLQSTDTYTAEYAHAWRVLMREFDDDGN